MFAACAEFGVELIEQPLPAGRDAALAEIARPVPVCADESVHAAADVGRLAGTMTRSTSSSTRPAA